MTVATIFGMTSTYIFFITRHTSDRRRGFTDVSTMHIESRTKMALPKI